MARTPPEATKSANRVAAATRHHSRRREPSRNKPRPPSTLGVSSPRPNTKLDSPAAVATRQPGYVQRLRDAMHRPGRGGERRDECLLLQDALCAGGHDRGRDRSAERRALPRSTGSARYGWRPRRWARARRESRPVRHAPGRLRPWRSPPVGRRWQDDPVGLRVMVGIAERQGDARTRRSRRTPLLRRVGVGWGRIGGAGPQKAGGRSGGPGRRPRCEPAPSGVVFMVHLGREGVGPRVYSTC